MSKAKKAARSDRRGGGPIGAWRLTLAVVSSGLLTGRALLDSAMSGQHLDLALGRSFGAACVIWIASGQVNRIFVDLERRKLEAVLSDQLTEDSLTADGESAQAQQF
jgi:hypothetical protein